MEEFVVDYFKNIAVHLKDFGHSELNPCFYYIKSMVDPGQVQMAIRNLRSEPVLLLEAPEGILTSNDSDNYFHNSEVAFSILIRATDHQENGELQSLYEEIDGIALKIFARLRRDRENGTLEYYEQELRYNKLGPIADGRFGKRYELKIGQAFGLEYDDNDWTD